MSVDARSSLNRAPSLVVDVMTLCPHISVILNRTVPSSLAVPASCIRKQYSFMGQICFGRPPSPPSCALELTNLVPHAPP